MENQTSWVEYRLTRAICGFIPLGREDVTLSGLFSLYGPHCIDCGIHLTLGTGYIHLVIPATNPASTHTYSNAVPVCYDCHTGVEG